MRSSFGDIFFQCSLHVVVAVDGIASNAGGYSARDIPLGMIGIVPSFVSAMVYNCASNT